MSPIGLSRLWNGKIHLYQIYIDSSKFTVKCIDFRNGQLA